MVHPCYQWFNTPLLVLSQRYLQVIMGKLYNVQIFLTTRRVWPTGWQPAAINQPISLLFVIRWKHPHGTHTTSLSANPLAPVQLPLCFHELLSLAPPYSSLQQSTGRLSVKKLFVVDSCVSAAVIKCWFICMRMNFYHWLCLLLWYNGRTIATCNSMLGYYPHYGSVFKSLPTTIKHC